MQVVALFYISEPATHLLTTATSPPGTEPGIEDASASFGAKPDSIEEPFMDEAQKKELRSIVIQELLQTTNRKGPPHQLSQHGEYSGWVWTMPENRCRTSSIQQVNSAVTLTTDRALLLDTGIVASASLLCLSAPRQSCMKP